MTRANFLSTRLRHAHGLLALLALATLGANAHADVCIPMAVAVEGLPGTPHWTGLTLVRKELNEPRWAAAQHVPFESDLSAKEGLHRMLVSTDLSELSVSFQALSDPKHASNLDAIYFAFTTDSTAGNLAKGVVIKAVSASSKPDPVQATTIQYYDYNVSRAPDQRWQLDDKVTTDDNARWVKDPFVWRNNPAGAVWGINFKVVLASAGLSSKDRPFKILLAMHKRDENTSIGNPSGVNLSTPDRGNNALYPNTLFIADPKKWATAAAVNSNCPGGITVTQLGTRNYDDDGEPKPDWLNTANGKKNRFYATISAPFGVTQRSLRGTFRVSNWGSYFLKHNAAWPVIPNGKDVENGKSPAANPNTFEFDCPVNADGKVCGLSLTQSLSQCVSVEIDNKPGNNKPITNRYATNCMKFVSLSERTESAEISVKGLKDELKNDANREVYLYVHVNNLPKRSKQLTKLRWRELWRTRSYFEQAPEPAGPVELVEVPESSLQEVTPESAPALAQPTGGATQPARVGAGAAQPPAPPHAASRGRMVKMRWHRRPRTGVQDLALTPQQALTHAWPTYDVHAYYASGRTVQIDDQTVNELVPMNSFTYYLEHHDVLYGFSHTLKLSEASRKQGVQWEAKPDANRYKLTIPSEGVAHIETSFSAHETPLVDKAPAPVPRAPSPPCR